VIKSFSANFEQIIIAGDPNFIKKIVEEGRKTKFEGVVEKLKFVMGGDWSPLTYFEYLKGALGAQNEDNLFSTFGVTEIGLNVGMADKSLQEVRKAIQNSKELQKVVFGL
jgi:phenylacetate-coenzyme A ligase PaaK-like adenylate-forming protein